MGITLHVTGYGRPAAERLAECIRDTKKDDPLRPVTVVVPTNSVGVAVRRALGRGDLKATDHGTGVVGMTFLTVYRLAELLGAPALAAQGRRPASTPVIAAALREELRLDAGVFAPVADHPATEESLIRAHRELSDCSEAALDTLAAASPRAAAVVDVHRRVRTRLAQDWYEEVDLLTAATDAIAAGSPIADDLGAVALYLPQNLSAAAAALLVAIGQVTEVPIVAASTGLAGADRDLRRTLRRLGLDAALDPATTGVTPQAATRVIAVSDPEEEAREAASVVLQAARSGVPFERMAILYPTDRPYARLVDDVLRAAEIPANGLAVRSLAERLAGRWLLDVLELPDRHYARAAVMSALTEAPVRDRSSGERVSVTSWERISRDAGVVRSLPEWHDRLTTFADLQRVEADRERAASEPRDWLVDKLEAAADDAVAFRSFVTRFLFEVDRGRGLESWHDLTGWARGLLHGYLGKERNRVRWPTDERVAADRVEAALDRLEGLDAVEPTTTLEVFRRTLQLELDADLGRRGTLGVGVLTGPPNMALGVDLDLVVMLGLAEGVFPPRVREDSLLSDRERRTVADELMPRAQRTEVLHRQYLSAVASADEAVLIWPRGDMRRSTERHPSRWLLDTCEALTGDRKPQGPQVTDLASYAARVASASFPLTDQDHALRRLADGGKDAVEGLATTDVHFGRGHGITVARRGTDFTRYDGNLIDVVDHLPSVLAPDGRVLSASALQSYVECPHAWYVQKVLRVDELEDPEVRLEISHLDRGSLVHDALETWLREQIDAGVPQPRQPWSPSARAHLIEVADHLFSAYEEQGLTGHRSLWALHRAQIRADLERFLDEDDALRAGLGLTPEGVEVPFGPVDLPLGDGRAIRIGGKVDRIDRRDDGGITVIDYKTGRVPDKPVSEANPDREGRRLQLLLYAAGLREQWDQPELSVHSMYWFVTARGDFKRIGYEVDADRTARLLTVLRMVVDGITTGRFPLVPGEMNRWGGHIPCAFCEPDGLGTADVYRRWERLREHPDLRAFVTITDPGFSERLSPPASEPVDD